MHDLLWRHDSKLLRWNNGEPLRLDDGEGHGVVGRMKLIGVDLVRRRRPLEVEKRRAWLLLKVSKAGSYGLEVGRGSSFILRTNL
jgi:hypothetical protein